MKKTLQFTLVGLTLAAGLGFAPVLPRTMPAPSPN